jgi:hypothetical protein
MLGRARLEKDDYPYLYYFAKEPFISMEKASDIATENIYDLFTLPPSIISQGELNNLQGEIHNISFNTSNDECSFN